MMKQRNRPKAMALHDGRALVIGDGYVACSGESECDNDPGPDQSAMHADLFDPATNTWKGTSGLNANRSDYAALVLQDGRVLVAGGYADYPYTAFSSAKLFDPATATWSQTTGLMNWARSDPAYALLADGRVLLAGGSGVKDKPLANAEIFDPKTGKWTMTADMPGIRIAGQAVTLKSGKVLVVGGVDGDYNAIQSAVLFDPATGKWSAGGTLNALPIGTLVALPDGGALVVGHGEENYDNDAGTSTWVVTAGERFDPNTLTWTKVGPMVKTRSLPIVASLADGRVLVAGGQIAESDDDTIGVTSTLTSGAEIFDPATNSWSATAAMPDVRQNGAAVLLKDGSVLAIGGDLGNQGEPSTPGGFMHTILATTVRYVP